MPGIFIPVLHTCTYTLPLSLKLSHPFLHGQGVAQLCSLLRYTTSLTTLRVDVAAPEGAEAIARDLPANRSLMHITLGGPVPDGLLTTMSEILANNTVRRINGSPGGHKATLILWERLHCAGENSMAPCADAILTLCSHYIQFKTHPT